jgi:demethylmenaquinone methyltransferase/2-methoxy-6-polyprenyl-1,4-benzoquinol methylase
VNAKRKPPQRNNKVRPNYDEEYVAHLFDQMGASYDVVNLISSFGFSEIWRAQCVGNLSILPGSVVADLMAGSGECWTYLTRRIQADGKILSVDFSRTMCERQRKRLQKFTGSDVAVRCENALSLSFSDKSVDFVISAFGLKTLDDPLLSRFAAEIFRVLRDGGSCSLLEISLPQASLLRGPYLFYIKTIIPLIGRLFLRNIECYKMLGVYTEVFGSCKRAIGHFQNAGFQVEIKTHFFGCASSIFAVKPGIGRSFCNQKIQP